MEEYAYIATKLGVAIGLRISSSINGYDETLGCKSLCLSCVCLIEDGALRFCHVAREEEALRNDCCLIFIGRSGYVHVYMGVHRLFLSSAIITPQMNG